MATLLVKKAGWFVVASTVAFVVCPFPAVSAAPPRGPASPRHAPPTAAPATPETVTIDSPRVTVPAPPGLVPAPPSGDDRLPELLKTVSIDGYPWALFVTPKDAAAMAAGGRPTWSRYAIVTATDFGGELEQVNFGHVGVNLLMPALARQRNEPGSPTFDPPELKVLDYRDYLMTAVLPTAQTGTGRTAIRPCSLSSNIAVGGNFIRAYQAFDGDCGTSWASALSQHKAWLDALESANGNQPFGDLKARAMKRAARDFAAFQRGQGQVEAAETRVNVTIIRGAIFTVLALLSAVAVTRMRSTSRHQQYEKEQREKAAVRDRDGR
jgi:hypothetical protein